jgi:hypothetical protein
MKVLVGWYSFPDAMSMEMDVSIILFYDTAGVMGRYFLLREWS